MIVQQGSKLHLPGVKRQLRGSSLTIESASELTGNEIELVFETIHVQDNGLVSATDLSVSNTGRILNYI